MKAAFHIGFMVWLLLSLTMILGFIASFGVSLAFAHGSEHHCHATDSKCH